MDSLGHALILVGIVGVIVGVLLPLCVKGANVPPFR